MKSRRGKAALRLISLSQPAPGLSALDFLRSAQGKERFYWREAHAAQVFAGFGSAGQLKAWGAGRFEEIEKQARRLFEDAWLEHSSSMALPRLVGGFAFRDDFVPDHTWAAFHPAHFILPHFQMAQAGEESWLTVNALTPAEEAPETFVEPLREALAGRYTWLLGQKTSEEAVKNQGKGRRKKDKVRYPMSAETWGKIIEAAVKLMHGGMLRKVVLARACEVICSGPIPVDQALRFLDGQYAGCYRFLFEPQPGHAFFGATPELLVQVDGERLQTMALAGSIRRGHDAEEDEALAAELLMSEKDGYEHRLVAQELERRLKPLTSKSCTSPHTQVMRLSNIQHLYTPFDAVLKHPRGVIPLVKTLHPTPAMGGTPREAAMAYIREAEPVPRGWYAAPIGWLDPSMDGTFAVAIRSAVAQNERAWLYAGAGIVAASQAEKEWLETELKFKPMLQALGVREK